MIILNLELDNLFAFKSFKINFSYERKNPNSTIPFEYLKDRPNFRFKKVNVIMGANASGKTSLGKALMSIFNFIERHSIKSIQDKIFDKTKTAQFSIDFIVDNEYLYRIHSVFSSTNLELLDVFRCKILKRDSYESCVKKLEALYVDKAFHERLELLQPIGWKFTFPYDDIQIYSMKENLSNKTLKIFDVVLKALDSAIIQVEQSDELDNSYIIRSKNGDVFVQNGEVVDKNILSSGTKAGLNIANLVSSIYHGENGFYYCDEQFSFVHSEIEKALFSVMISLLKPYDQLFFTTHNLDMLDMNIPLHTFTFLRKNEKIEAVYPFQVLQKKKRALRNAVENDVFDALPDISGIFLIEEMNSEQGC